MVLLIGGGAVALEVPALLRPAAASFWGVVIVGQCMAAGVLRLWAAPHGPTRPCRAAAGLSGAVRCGAVHLAIGLFCATSHKLTICRFSWPFSHA